MAEILEIHMRALDRNDENSIQELDAYRKLAEQHRRVAQQLQAIGQEMAGYRDLPMGRHDMEKMSSPEPVAAFAKFVKLEKDLVALLQKRLQQDEKMLGEMSGNP